MKQEQTTEEAVRELVVKNLGIDKDTVFFPETDFDKDFGADSLNKVEMVMALEDEFGIEITDGDADGIRTFKDMVNCVERLRKEKS